MPAVSEYSVDSTKKLETYIGTSNTYSPTKQYAQHTLDAQKPVSSGMVSPGREAENSSSPVTMATSLADPVKPVNKQNQSNNPSDLNSHTPTNATDLYSPSSTTDAKIVANGSAASSPSSGSQDGGGAKKRTASGTVKVHNRNSMEGFVGVHTGTSHSRNTSINSTTSSVGELSFQLKTRLTHAMSKLQHGMERPSVMPSDPLYTPVISSPIATSRMSNTHSQSIQATGISTNGLHRRSLDTDQSIVRPLPPQTRPMTSHSTSDPVFKQASNLGDHSSSHPPRTLAPAPEIVSSSRAGRTKHIHKKPSLSTSSRPSMIATEFAPSQEQRAPSTPTAQEQDAVDTLLFMSGSPASSAQFPRHANATPSSQTSPRKSQLGQPSTRENFQSPTGRPIPTPRFLAPTSIGSSSDGEPSTQHVQHENKRKSTGLTLATEKDVDQLLDQIAANRNSDDEDPTNIIRIKTSATPLVNGSIINM